MKKNLLCTYMYNGLKIFKITSFCINIALLPYLVCPLEVCNRNLLQALDTSLALFSSFNNDVLLNFVSSEGRERSLAGSGLNYREAALPRCASPETPLCVATCDSVHCRDPGKSKYQRSPYEQMARVSVPNFFSFMQNLIAYRALYLDC